jgi:membrane protease YdiL (CAAX protease family)
MKIPSAVSLATAIILPWLGLMSLLFVNWFIGGPKITVIAFQGYSVVVALAIPRLIEKKSIIQRFGLQRNNTLILIVAVYLMLATAYYLGNTDLNMVFLAPLVEEMLFRGYFLGRLVNYDGKIQRWSGQELTSIFSISVLFGASHVFVYYPSLNSQALAQMFVISISSITLGFLYAYFKTILWCFVLHMLINLTDYINAAFLRNLLVVPTLIIAFAYLIKLAREKGNEHESDP